MWTASLVWQAFGLLVGSLMTLRTLSGTLRYRVDHDGYWLVAEVDPALGAYYRALMPKYLGLKRGRYDTHCTIVRGGRDVPMCMAAWGRYEGEPVSFFYEPGVRSRGCYYWLGVLSKRFEAIRLELGLMLDNGAYDPPPVPFVKWFHITVGNSK